MAGIKKWNGSSWVDGSVKKWNGSSWVQGLVKKWNGSSWVQIYPDTVGQTNNQQVTVSSGMATYRPKWGNWENGDAKQGNGEQYSGSYDCTGCLNIRSSSFPGYGKITEVTSASFTGKRGGAGSYNNNQTIRFFRSNVSPNSGDPRSSLSGEFTSTTGAPGSGGTMNNRSISGMGGVKDWLNGVNGKDILYIRSNSSSEYLSIAPNFTITASYNYNATLLTFTKDDTINQGARIPHSSEIYHEMFVYDDEVNMTLDEIIKHREENNISEIKNTDIIDFNDIKPYYIEYNIGEKDFTIDIYACKTYHKCEISFDGDKYNTLKHTNKQNVYRYELPEWFNKYKDSIHIRVINTENDSIDMERIIEPSIIIL